MYVKICFNLLIIAFSLLVGNVSAGEKINKSLDVSAEGEVEIHNNRGKITILGWDKNQVLVKGELDDLAERFVFETKNDRTLIKVILPNRNSRARGGSGSNLQIFCPKGFSLQFGGVSTDLKVSDLKNDVDISSVSGDIKLSSIAGKAYVNSVSGNIIVNQVKGKISVSTVSGDVDAKVTSSDIEITGVSSDIKVSTVNIDSAEIETVSGDTTLRGELNESATIRLSNVSGKSIYFTKQLDNAKVNLNTGPGGEIINKLTSHEATRSFIGSERLKFSVGEGSARIRMSTVSGEIGLRSK